MVATWTVACPECGAEHQLCYVISDVVPNAGDLKFTCPKTKNVATVTPPDPKSVEVAAVCPNESIRASRR